VPASLDDYRWLISEDARPWLDLLRDEPSIVTPAFVARLRKDLSAERAHLVIEQVQLRRRAREKFSLADQMFFTRKGLEQATDERLAVYKAERFAGGLLADLCCGIGGDLMALVCRTSVCTFGVDSDPVAALLAAKNMGLVGRWFAIANVEVHQFDSFRNLTAWHCDPDRRIETRRTTDIEEFSPPLSVLDDHLEAKPNGAIKLAPITEVPPHWWGIAEREWLGSRGECRQQVVWFGSLARYPGRNIATIVAADGSARSIVGSASEQPPVASKLGRYLYEPHATILAANVSATLCRLYGRLAAVSEGIGYLTGDQRLNDPAMAGFEVQEVLPFDRKQLRGWCRQHNVGRLEIKKRGVDIDPERVRSEIIAAGDNEATLILAPIAGQVKAIVAKRMSH
jgi:hypothetical protein